MGADWLQLFNKRLCDEIVALKTHALPEFVKRHQDLFGEFSIFRYGFNDVPATDRIQRLLEGGETEASLRAHLVDALCFSERMVYLDYWGCYVEVFASADPPGAIADFHLFPERQQQNFLLLLPNHVDHILDSLSVHRPELTVMTEEDVNVVRQWRDICTADPSRMVAYVFDV